MSRRKDYLCADLRGLIAEGLTQAEMLDIAHELCDGATADEIRAARGTEPLERRDRDRRQRSRQPRRRGPLGAGVGPSPYGPRDPVTQQCLDLKVMKHDCDILQRVETVPAAHPEAKPRKLVAPNGAEIEGTLETLTGVAIINGDLIRGCSGEFPTTIRAARRSTGKVRRP